MSYVAAWREMKRTGEVRREAIKTFIAYVCARNWGMAAECSERLRDATRRHRESSVTAYELHDQNRAWWAMWRLRYWLGVY